jgi:hypothetical protein
MHPTEETKSPFGKPLSRIYQTDPFGFPLHAADEEIYNKEMEEQKALTAANKTSHLRTDKDATSIEQ